MPRTLPTLLISLLLLISGSAPAGGISVSPVLLHLDARHPSVSVAMTNSTGEEKVFQADPVLWSHREGQDVYEATTRLIASPPLFRLRPGAKQIVRVGLADPSAAPSNEGTYRLFLQEVPDHPPSNQEGGAQLKMLLRFGLPVFLKPEKAAPESLVWAAHRTAAGIKLEVRNTGNVHARISDLEMTPAGAAAALRVDGFVYLFGGESRSWTLTPDKAWRGSSVKISARTDQGVSSADLPLEGG